MEDFLYDGVLSRREFMQGAACTAAGALMSNAVIPSLSSANGALGNVKRVIVVMSDTMRRDCLSCYGGSWVDTPFLDKLAQESVVFDRNYVASFPTIPSRTDLFTGKYTLTYRGWEPLGTDEVVLSQCLSNAGFVTQLIADTPHLMNNGFRFDRGFQGWWWTRGQEGDRLNTAANESTQLPCDPKKLRDEGRLLRQHMRNTLDWKGEDDRFVVQTLNKACRWLENNYKAEKFFLWIDGFDPHEPWDAPQSYIDRYYPNYKGNKPINPDYNFADIYTPDELKYIRAAYAAEVTLVDRWIGHLLKTLEELGLKDSTAIIHTSDHGFYLGEHNRVGKHHLRGAPWQLYEEVAHIPLLARIPGVAGGLRIRNLVQPQDLLPAILDLCGVSIPETVQGKSWIPLLSGSPNDLHSLAISSGPLDAKMSLITTPVTVTNNDWSLIFGCPEVPPELYHLSLDAVQKQNVIHEYPEIAKSLQEQVRQLLVGLKTPDDKMKAIQFF